MTKKKTVTKKKAAPKTATKKKAAPKAAKKKPAQEVVYENEKPSEKAMRVAVEELEKKVHATAAASVLERLQIEGVGESLLERRKQTALKHLTVTIANLTDIKELLESAVDQREYASAVMTMRACKDAKMYGHCQQAVLAVKRSINKKFFREEDSEDNFDDQSVG